MTCVTVIGIALIDASKCSVLALSIKKKYFVFVIFFSTHNGSHVEPS